MNLMKQISATLLLLCLVTFTYAQGDDCASAVAITPGMYTADGPSAGMGASQADATNSDWYSFTPTASGLTSINSCMGGGDTRLWVWSGGCAAPVLEANNDDFCDLGDGTAYASSVSNVVTLAGSTYLIEWDDRWSVDTFDFTLNFVEAPPADGAVVGDAIPFYQIPVSQLPATGIPLVATVTNLGYNPISDVTVSVDVQDASGASVFMNTSSPVASLAAFEEVDVTAAAWNGPAGNYTVCFTTTITEMDGEPANDTYCRALWISQTTYGVDDPAGTTGGLGITGPGTIDQGQAFYMNNADMMTSISAFIGGGAAGDTIVYQVFEINADTVSTLVYDSGVTTVVAPGQGWTHHVMTAPLAVNADQWYMVNTFHRATGTNIALGTTGSIWAPGNAWVNVNAGGWTHPEAFGFNIAYLLRPNFGVGTYTCTATVDMSNETVDAAGVSVAYWDSAVTLVTNPCTDNMDGTWTCQFSGTSLDNGGYLFVNGATNEVAPMACGMDPGVGFNYRPVQIGFQDAAKGLVCFADCGSCPTAACTGPNEILCENMEIYDASMPLGPQSPDWTTWSGTEGGAEDGIVSTAQAASGNNSLSIVGGAGGGPQDVVLLMGDLTSGRYRTTFNLYVPAGNGAYYNIQHFEAPGTEWAHQIIFNADGTAQLDAEANAIPFNYTQDAWITVDQIIDIDNDWTTLMVDGQQLAAWPFNAQANAATGTNQLGAYNFYPLDDTNVFFVDDVYLEHMPACGLDFETIICDDFEFYADGSIIGPQSSYWTTWSGTEGTAEDALASSDYALSGVTSMLIAEGSAQDVILDLGNRTTGYFELKWMMYIPTGANGYYNLQGSQTAGEFFIVENELGAGGAGQINGGAGYTYPNDTWFEVKHLIDLDNDAMEISVNGAVVEAAWLYENNLGGVDFYSIDATNRYYVDNLSLKQLPPPPSTRSVTFHCNMNAMIDAMALSTDGVHIAGDFQGWDPAASEMLDTDGDGIYSFTASLEEGQVVQFKYVNGNAWGGDETNITADCGVDGGAGSFNRVWTVGTQDEETPAWCFNECLTNCSVSIDEVTFDSSLKLYPNPASGNTAIYYNFPEAVNLDIRLTNSVGQVVYSNMINNAVTGNVEIDVEKMVPGVYFVMMSDGENLVSKKLFIER